MICTSPRTAITAAIAAGAMTVSLLAAPPAMAQPTPGVGAHSGSVVASASIASTHRYEEGILQLRDSQGNVLGYSVTPDVQVQLDALRVALAKSSDGEARAEGVVGCIAGITVFIATTVFPTARAVRLAVKLGQLVAKYGAKKMAQILTRTIKLTSAEKKIRDDIISEIVGIAALAPCLE